MASALSSRDNIEHGGSSRFFFFFFTFRSPRAGFFLKSLAPKDRRHTRARKEGRRGLLGEKGREGGGGKEERKESSLQTVGMAELVHQSLAALRLLHDALLVVLPDAAAELVVIHGGTILSFAPEPRHPHRVLDLEDPLAAVQPTYAGTVDARALQQFLQELPQVNVAAAVTHLAATRAASARTLTGSAVLILVCTQKINPNARDEGRKVK